MPRLTTPDVELIEPRVVRVKCRKCGTLIRLSLATSREPRPRVALKQQDYPRECPGFHNGVIRLGLALAF